MSARVPIRAVSSMSIVSRAAVRPSRPCLYPLETFSATQLRPRRWQKQCTRNYSSIPPPPLAPESQISKRPVDLRSQLYPAESPPSLTPTHPKRKRSLRPYIYATFFLMVGLAGGSTVRLIIAPPPQPAAGTKEDNRMVEFLNQQAEKLPIVQSLSTDPAWTSHDAYTSLPIEERSRRLTTGPLAGARAVGGFQRIFYNEESGETVTVIWFGGAIAGWPGVTHGGVTATIMDESLGRCAIRHFPSRTGVTANLELNYLKPIQTNSFYVIRAMPEQGFTDRKGWVSGRLETIEGRVCVEAKALFVVPKNYKPRVIPDKF